MDYMLGKLPQKVDKRTFKLRAILNKKLLPPLPDEYITDSTCPSLLDNFMFANDKYGCCVMSGRAHITLRFECFEQGQIITISDDDVVNAYLHESGGADSGLVMLDSLRNWRKEGWWAGGKAYNIYAFAQISIKQHNDCRYAVFIFRGAYIGVALPKSAKNQDVWDVVEGPDGEWGSWGGHCVYVNEYNAIGPVCITWGKRQQMTWDFWDKYVDEAYAIIDNRDTFVNAETNPLNCEKLVSLLEEVSPVLPEPPNPNPPNPPTPEPHVPWYEKIKKFFRDLYEAIKGWFVDR